MIQNYLTRIFGSRNERLLKGYRKTVAQINALEPQMQPLTDEQLAAKTVEFRQRIEADDVLRTGKYAKTLTFTLAPRTP